MIDLVNETFGIPLAEKLTHFTSDLLHHRSGLSPKKLKLSTDWTMYQGEPLLLLHAFSRRTIG